MTRRAKKSSGRRAQSQDMCPPGQHWVRGHHERNRLGFGTHWVSGHCAKNGSPPKMEVVGRRTITTFKSPIAERTTEYDERPIDDNSGNY